MRMSAQRASTVFYACLMRCCHGSQFCKGHEELSLTPKHDLFDSFTGCNSFADLVPLDKLTAIG